MVKTTYDVEFGPTVSTAQFEMLKKGPPTRNYDYIKNVDDVARNAIYDIMSQQPRTHGLKAVLLMSFMRVSMLGLFYLLTDMDKLEQLTQASLSHVKDIIAKNAELYKP